jgi:MFS family permease
MKNKNALILFLTVFIDMMGFSVIFPIFPETLRFYIENGNDVILKIFIDLVESKLAMQNNPYFIVLFGGLIGSIYAILQFLFSPIWGRWSDRIGRKKILQFTSLGSFLGYLTWFFSGSFSTFVLSRVITGIMGGNISVASASMADMTSAEDRAKGMGIIGAGIGLGFIFGPPLGGIMSGVDLIQIFPVLESVGTTVYSSSALISVLVSLLNLIMIFTLYTETYSGEITQQRKFLHPVLGIFHTNSKLLPFLSLIYFLFTFGFSGFEFCINFFFYEALQFSPREIGFSFVYMGGIVILIQGGVIRRISGKISEKKIALFGSISLLIGFSLISNFHSVQIVFVSLFFLSMGSAFLNPSLSSMASLYSSTTEQGKNLGILRGFGSLARALAPLCFSFLYFSLGAKFAFYLSLGIVSLVFLLLFRIPPKETTRSDRI